MLTRTKKARRSLRHEASRAGSQAVSKAQGALTGAGDVAKSARTTLGKRQHQVYDQADRRVTGARHAAASRLFNTASRLSSAAEVVEHGRRPRHRRWPLVAALAAVLAATGVVVTRVARSMRGQAEPTGEDTPSRQDAPSGDGERRDDKGRRASEPERSTVQDAGRSSEPAEVNRHTEPTAASGSTHSRNNARH